MTPISLVKLTNVLVLIGSLGACGFPFLVVLPVPPAETLGVQPVAVADPTSAKIAEQQREERRERRQDRSERIEERRERNNSEAQSGLQTRERNDENDDSGRDGGQAAWCCADDDVGRDGGQIAIAR